MSSVANSPAPPFAVTTYRIAIWIFCTFCCFYFLCSSGRVRTPDEYMTLYETESLVLRHSTAVPQALQTRTFYGKYDLHSQPRAPYPFGQALLATPWYAFGRYVVAHFPGVPPDDLDLVVAFTSCLSNSAYAAAAVALGFLILISIGIPLRDSLLATSFIGLATPLFAYSSWFFSEPLTTALLFAAAFFLFGRKNDSLSRRAAICSGLLLAATVLVRPTNVFEIAIFFAALLATRRKFDDRAFSFAAAAALGVIILLVYNTIVFGNPLEFGYPAAAEAGKSLNTFHTPLLVGLCGFLLSPGKSIFLFAPPIVFALFGLGKLWKTNRGLAAIAGFSLPLYILFFSKYTQWEGGYCFGPRYLVPSLALLCLAIGPALSRGASAIRYVAAALGIAGFAVQAIGMATSFLQDQAMTGRYYDATWTYRLSYSLRGQFDLLLHYLTDPRPAPLGLGFDRWFVFLAKAGVSHSTVAVLAIAMLVALLFCLSRLKHSISHSTLT